MQANLYTGFVFIIWKLNQQLILFLFKELNEVCLKYIYDFYTFVFVLYASSFSEYSLSTWKYPSFGIVEKCCFWSNLVFCRIVIHMYVSKYMILFQIIYYYFMGRSTSMTSFVPVACWVFTAFSDAARHFEVQSNFFLDHSSWIIPFNFIHWIVCYTFLLIVEMIYNGEIQMYQLEATSK